MERSVTDGSESRSRYNQALLRARTVVVAATLLRQSIDDCRRGMEAPCCYGSGKRVQPVETVFFPEPATSGGPRDV